MAIGIDDMPVLAACDRQIATQDKLRAPIGMARTALATVIGWNAERGCRPAT